MGAETVQDWKHVAASALEWWRDAGVDALVEEAPRDWLARPAARAPAAEAPAGPVAPQPEAPLPQTLEAFLAWRLGAAAPEADWLTPLVAPEGPSDAEWVVLTDMPEGEALMDGAAGRLFDRMLAAVGLSRESVHLMSLAAARPLSGRIPPDAEPRLIALAQHQLGLVKPRKLLILGQAASRVLGETKRAANANPIQEINHFGGMTRVVASFHPRFLLDRPAAKNEAWKHLLLLSRGTSE